MMVRRSTTSPTFHLLISSRCDYILGGALQQQQRWYLESKLGPTHSQSATRIAFAMNWHCGRHHRPPCLIELTLPRDYWWWLRWRRSRRRRKNTGTVWDGGLLMNRKRGRGKGSRCLLKGAINTVGPPQIRDLLLLLNNWLDWSEYSIKFLVHRCRMCSPESHLIIQRMQMDEAGDEMRWVGGSGESWNLHVHILNPAWSCYRDPKWLIWRAPIPFNNNPFNGIASKLPSSSSSPTTLSHWPPSSSELIINRNGIPWSRYDEIY